MNDKFYKYAERALLKTLKNASDCGCCREDQYVKAIALEFTGRLCDVAYGTDNSPRLCFDGAFIHRSPIVAFSGEDGECRREAGDLLVIMADMDKPKDDRLSAVMFQAKMVSDKRTGEWPYHRLSQGDKDQFFLYRTWPIFRTRLYMMCDGILKKTRREYDLHQHEAHPGAQYMFLQKDSAGVSNGKAFVSQTNVKMKLTDKTFIAFLKEFIDGKNGVPVKWKSNLGKEDDWSRFVWDIIAHVTKGGRKQSRYTMRGTLSFYSGDDCSLQNDAEAIEFIPSDLWDSDDPEEVSKEDKGGIGIVMIVKNGKGDAENYLRSALQYADVYQDGGE